MIFWILQLGEPIHLDSDGFRPMRLINLSDALTEQGHDVIVWTNNFDHFQKKHRLNKGLKTEVKYSHKLTYKLIRSIGYKKNVGLRRIIDHIEIAIRLSVEIRRTPLPDACFVGYPPIESAYVMTKYLKSKKIPIVVDVKDYWPDIFVRPFPRFLQVFVRPFFFFAFSMMNYVMREANTLVAPSRIFLNHFQEVSGRGSSRNDHVVPLTVKKNIIDESEIEKQLLWWGKLGVPKDHKLIISFIGSLTDVFDFEPLIALANNTDIFVVIAGDGPLHTRLKSKLGEKRNFLLPGRISHNQAMALLKLSSASCLPYKNLPDFNSNLPNKFFDCLANGTPILCSDYGLISETVQKFKLGLTYSTDGDQSLSLIVDTIRTNPKILNEFSQNAKDLYDNVYSHRKVYGDLVKSLVSLLPQNLAERKIEHK